MLKVFGWCILAGAIACSSDDTVTGDASIDQTSDQTTSGPPDAKTNDSAPPNDASVDVAQDSSETDAIADVIEEPIVDAAPDVIVTNDGGGCTQNSQCSSADYCAKADSDCNGIGSCMAKPQFCPQLAKPVCGCNKKTYINYCYAQQAGTNVAYNGACE